MSEKRFEYDEHIGRILYWKEGLLYQLDVNNLEDCVEVLNQLNDENEQLKKQINELVKGIQDSAKISADAMCKRMNKNVWGDV